MTAARYDVLGLGNAIVDVITRTEDAFLAAHDMRKGGMALIDEARAQAIYDAMGPAVEVSGGSAANTIVGLSSLAGRGAFVGRVKSDDLGHAFSHDIRAAGVAFTTPPASGGSVSRKGARSATNPLISAAATEAEVDAYLFLEVVFHA